MCRLRLEPRSPISLSLSFQLFILLFFKYNVVLGRGKHILFAMQIEIEL